MGWVVPAITGISALAGFLGNRKKTTTATQQSTSSSASNYQNTNTTTPNLTPEASGLLDDLKAKFASMLGGTDLSGYKAGGFSDINRFSDIAKQNTEESLASRGISGPAVGTAIAGHEAGRVAGLSKFSQGIPLLQNELDQQMLTLGTNLFSQIPYGSTSTATGSTTSSGTSSGTGTNTDPGNSIAGLFANLGPMLAFLYGQGAFPGAPGGGKGGVK